MLRQIRKNNTIGRRLACLLLLLCAWSARAGHPLPVEDFHFFPESGWNRSEAALAYNTILSRGSFAHEIAQEWTAGNHQAGFTLPLYTRAGTGLGDATLNYRYQLVGGAASRVGVAPRISLVLPTRSAAYGERADGLQLNLPVSVAITPRLESHTSVGVTWFRRRNERELTVGQSLGFAATEQLTVALDTSYTRAHGGEHVIVVRPGLQVSFDLGNGVTFAPGVAAPLGGGVMFFVAVEHPLWK